MTITNGIDKQVAHSENIYYNSIMNDKDNNKPSNYPSINVLKAISSATGRLAFLDKHTPDTPLDDVRWVIKEALRDLEQAQIEFDKVLQDHRTDIKDLKFKEIYNKSPFQVN